MALGEKINGFPSSPVGKWVQLVGTLVILPLLAWGFVIERRVTRIESNRFTASDGLNMYQALNDKADKEDVPPPEVQQAIARLNADIAEIKGDLKNHISDITAELREIRRRLPP